MTKAEFDQYAESYDEMHRQSIAFSGCDAEYFAHYKIAATAKDYRRLCKPGEPILDFGCGPGNSIPYFKSLLSESTLIGADVSNASLEEARKRFGPSAEYLPIKDHTLNLEPGSVGLAFSACVFHHIPPAEHIGWLRELRRVVRPGGPLVIFEHNPYNPLTQHAVANCVFDKDAILLNARTLKARLRAAGWKVERVRYHVFFPQILSFMRPVEPLLAKVPLGGQYSVLAV